MSLPDGDGGQGSREGGGREIAEAMRSVKRLSAELLALAEGSAGMGSPSSKEPPAKEKEPPGKEKSEKKEERWRAQANSGTKAQMRLKIVSLRERLETAARDNRQEEVAEIMQEIAVLVGATLPRLPAPVSHDPRETWEASAAGLPAAPPPASPQGLSTAAVIFLLANTVMATATITSIAWFLAQSAALQRTDPTSGKPMSAPSGGGAPHDMSKGTIELGRRWGP